MPLARELYNGFGASAIPACVFQEKLRGADGSSQGTLS